MKLRNVLVYGNRRYDPNKNIPEGAERLFRYYRLIQEWVLQAHTGMHGSLNQ